MDYSIMEQIRIRIKKYEVVIDNGNPHIVFPTDVELETELQVLIDNAKKEVKDYRRYPSDWTAEQIDDDIEENYSHIVVALVLFDNFLEGAEFETAHNENGVSRSFVKRESILGKIIPFCNIL